MKKQLSIIALAVILSACGSESDDSDSQGKYSPVYDLSSISKSCGELNSEVVKTDIPGLTIYVYAPVNKCSPAGTNIFSFVMSDSLDTVAGYFEITQNVSYSYGYVSIADMNFGSVGPISGDRTPSYASIEGTDENGAYEIDIDISQKTKTVERDGIVTTYSDYTQADFLKDFPKQMHQETALNLFKLSNNQKPDL